MWNLFYRNRRLLILAVGTIVVAGLASYQVLPRLEDPELTSRFATVKTILPGADAQRVEALVTEKLEEEIREIEELKLIESQSRVGFSTITLELRDDVYEVDEVWSRVRDKVDDAAVALPENALEPEFEVTDVGAFALILALAWEQDDQPNYAILRRQAEELEQVLRSVPGTEKIETFGDPVEEILVEVSAEQLASTGLTVDGLARQLSASDAKTSAGQYRSDASTFLMEVDSELDSIERIRHTPVNYSRDGRFVPLGNIAQISKGVKTPPDSLAVVEGLPAVVVAARVQSSARIDAWAESAQKAVSDFGEQLPAGIRLVPVFEQSKYVAARMEELGRNLLFGGLAVLVVMFFMMGWRSALIVGLALPLSSLMVLTGLRVLGIPIQQMSVTGLIIALGLLIDNAIVTVDEVRHRLQEGAPPGDAVAQTAKHLAVPLFGSTLTTALAFAPIALMPGPTGEFVGAIAVSVILAIFSSLFLALTVVATLAAMGAGDVAQSRKHWWNEGVANVHLTRLYEWSLDTVLARPVLGIALAVALPITGFLTLPLLTEQFFPPEERNQFQIELELPAHASLNQTLERIQLARAAVMDDPEVARADWFLGESAPSFYYNVIPTRQNTSQYAQAIVTTRSRLRSKALLRRMQHDLDAAFPESRVLVRQLEQGAPFDAPVEVRLLGPDVGQLARLGDQLRSILAETPHVLHTTADLTETMPKLALRVDEESARLAGLDNAAISKQLDATLEGAVGGSVLEGTEELPVRVRVSSRERGDLDRITSLDLVSQQAGAGNGAYVPIQALADVELLPEPAIIAHRNGSRVNEVKAHITSGILPAHVVAAFQERLEASDLELPLGYTLEYGGEAAERDNAVGNLFASVAPLMVVMVASLVLAFGSFRLAGLIGGVGFLSIGLGMAMLWLFDYPIGFMAIIGTMGLVGVAINDSIVVLAALRDDPSAREGDRNGIRRVVFRSTRHVVATSLTTLAGFAPLVLWGGAFWAPLAVTIAGGVAGATLLALYFVPCVYAMMAGSRHECVETNSHPVAEARQPRVEEVSVASAG